MSSPQAVQDAEVAWIHVGPGLLVADKPAGLLSVPGRGPDKADCLWARVRARHPDALVVHRLDMATSGLIAFARGAAMQRELSRRFEARQVRKQYVAVVAGLLAEDGGEIDLPLAADWPRRPRQQVDRRHGRPASTRWQVLARDSVNRSTRLLLDPATGRSHQLRVHLAAIGHPILGDELYRAAVPKSAAPRLLLHATLLDLGPLAAGEPAAEFRSAAPF